MALEEYRRKRKFSETPEPKGAKPKRARAKDRAALTFCVQMHKASRLHFDFRLELDGVLKSWAVPRGPSLSPLEQRLAVLVEDHPIEYGDFEGTIPGGNYGAGTVVLWDRGTYRERGSATRAESEKALRKGFAEGHITFVLSGHKLRGEFALVRLKNAREPNAWLLIKKRDEFAVDRPDRQPGNESVKTGRSLERVAKEAGKKGEVWLPGKGSDARAPSRDSADAKAKARAAVLPHRVKPMIAVTARRGEDAPKAWVSCALPEGKRAIAEVEAHGSVRIHSKDLLSLERGYPRTVGALAALRRGLVLDGFVGAGDRFTVIDLLYAEGSDLRELPLKDRLRRLEALKIFGGPIARAARPDNNERLARDPGSRYVSGVSSHWLLIHANDAAAAARTSAAGGLPAVARASTAGQDSQPQLTHLEKIVWPAEKITKGDLIEYYRAVAPFLLPHLKDRPQSMHRHPNGIKRQSFFQKDLSGYYPRWIETARIHSAHSRRTINFLLCNDERTLLYMANLGCIELNPWLSRRPTLDNPDFCVIDLDPHESMPFRAVVKVAVEVKRVLDQIGIPAFCKTSGSSGIHIFIPLGRGHDYDFSRELALGVCRIVNERLPDLTTLERNPASRRKKLYLDCFQNSRGQTLASIYCARPRAGAPVSTPLRWSELKPALEPGDFTIKTVPRRLARLGDLWARLLKADPTAAQWKKWLARLGKLRKSS